MTCTVTIDAPGSTPIHVSGRLTQDTTWNANQIYIVDSTVTVGTGVTLTVAPGAVVKFDWYAALDVEGRLFAGGSDGNPITFTSLNDDSVAGDTDGTPTSGWKGWWVGVRLRPDSDANVLEGCRIAFAQTGIEASNASLSVSNTRVADCSQYGIFQSISAKSRPASIVVEDSTVTGCSYAGIWLDITNGDVNHATPVAPVVRRNTVTSNGGQGIRVHCHSVDSPIADPIEPRVEDNVVSSNGDSAGEYAVEVTADLLRPDLATNTGTGNRCQALALAGVLADDWTVPSDLALPLVILNYPHNYYWSYRYGIVVPSGRTLTIEPGSTVRFAAYSSYNYDYQACLWVQGRVLAQGTSVSPITFTSVLDDTVGGDAYGDGSSYAPSRQDWRGLAFLADSDGSVLDFVASRYAALGVQATNASFAMTNSTVREFAQYGVQVDTDESKATPDGAVIEDNVIRDGDGTGVWVEVTNSNVNRVTPLAPTIRRNSITSNKGQGLVVHARSITSPLAEQRAPVVTQNVVSNNGDAANEWAITVRADRLSPTLSTNSGVGNRCQVMVLAGEITDDWTWANSASFVPALDWDYEWGSAPRLEGVIVPAGKALTIEAGVTVKGLSRYAYWGYGASLDVNGQVLAQGTADAPVVFTSIKDDSSAGDSNGDGVSSTPQLNDLYEWSGITFRPDSAGSILNHTEMRWSATGIRATNAAFSMANSLIDHVYGTGVTISTDETKSDPSGITLESNTIRNCSGYAVDARVTNGNVNRPTPLPPTIRNNVFANNIAGGVTVYARSVDSAVADYEQPVVENNVFTNNGNSQNLSGYQWPLVVTADRLSPSLSTNTGTGNSCSGMVLCGEIAADWTWKKDASLLPVLSYDTASYAPQGSLYGVIVPAGKSLTVEPGAVVKALQPSYWYYTPLSVKGVLLGPRYERRSHRLHVCAR